MKDLELFNEHVFFYINKKFKTWGTMAGNQKGMAGEIALSKWLGLTPHDIELIAIVPQKQLTPDIRIMLTDRVSEVAKAMFNDRSDG